MVYDAYNFLSNKKKLAWISDAGVQNDFDCPEEFPALIDAMQHPLYGPIGHFKDPAGGEAPPQTEGYGVIFFCCVE